MAPRRKKQPPLHGREFKIRLPEDIADRIRSKAEREGRPQNRIIINELAAVPRLEQADDFATLIGAMQNTLARYGSRIAMHDLSDELLRAVDAVLKAEGGALQATVDKLRVVRSAMLQHERTQAKGKPAK